MLTFSNIATAEKSKNIITIHYSPFAVVEGDSAEEDFITNDDYSHLSLNPGTAKGIKWVHIDNAMFFLEYFSIKTKTDNGQISQDKYQAMTLGSGVQGTQPLNGSVDIYYGIFVGAGGSRFKFNKTQYKAHADLSGELGVLITKRLSISAGVKYQIIGYPTETMAEVLSLNLSLGLWF